MTKFRVVRGQRNIVNLAVTMPIPGAIDWSTSWLQFEMIIPRTTPPEVVVRKSTRTTPNNIVLFHDHLVRITLEPADTRQIPPDVTGLDWKLELHLGDFNAYILAEGSSGFEAGFSPPVSASG